MDTNTQKQDRGFTLVELLIVIVILGILATVTVFAVRGITDKGQESACNADAKTLAVATEAYFAQYGGTAIPYTGSGAMPAGANWAAGLGANPGQTLENAGLLRDVSQANYTVAADGTLSPTVASAGPPAVAASPCPAIV
jgi:prepilin-type N-terminal cleavage/methylation domain-containing protein